LRRRPFLVAVGVAAFVTTGVAVTASRLTRNYTPSLPLGVYWLRPGLPPIKGEIVDLAIPLSARALIAGRYLPVGFRLLKRVVAVEGDHVCLHDRQYRVNGVKISTIAPADSVGRALPVFSFCGDVPEGMAFVATPVPSSLDSRYFGPVPMDALTVARPLWTF
jgi:conjugative transfer signal peptidase TraF